MLQCSTSYVVVYRARAPHRLAGRAPPPGPPRMPVSVTHDNDPNECL